MSSGTVCSRFTTHIASRTTKATLAVIHALRSFTRCWVVRTVGIFITTDPTAPDTKFYINRTPKAGLKLLSTINFEAAGGVLAKPCR
jgi:hypothetical protein